MRGLPSYERAEHQAQDAAERLEAIQDAQNEALAVIKAAIEKLADEVDAQGMAGAGWFAAGAVPEILEAVRERLDEAAHSVVSDLEDMECGEGRYDLATLRAEHDEARRDAEREARS
jgi:hypothetical protein